MKKLLALVLALVMTLSLCVTSNAAFSDAASINGDYKEAVEVMSAIGVLQGDNGAFNPTGSLTREQGAKIIAYMVLGTTAADALSATKAPFADVAADRWSAGVIQYCVSQGIIAGVGDNKFDPTGALTGYAFAKMALTALGWNASIEGLTGAEWQLNTAKLAISEGLTSGLTTVNMTQPMTREQAAQMGFNAMTSNMVYYKGGVNVEGADGMKVTMGADAYNQPNEQKKDYRYPTVASDGVLQLCEMSFPTLKLAGDTDKFGAPATAWVYGSTKIDKYTESPTFTYTSDMTTSTGAANDTIKADLAKYSFVTAKAYTNGEQLAGTTTFNSANPNDVNVGILAALTGDGKAVEVYTSNIWNNINEVYVPTVTRVVVKQYDLFQVSNKIDSTNTIVLKSVTATTAPYVEVIKDGKNKDFYDALSALSTKDYVVLAIKSDAATIVGTSTYTTATGSYTAYNKNTGYTIGGTAYMTSALAKTKALDDAGLGTTVEFTVYLDSYGYLLFAVANNAVKSEMGYLLGTVVEGTSATNYTYTAKILKSDGKILYAPIKTVEISKAADGGAIYGITGIGSAGAPWNGIAVNTKVVVKDSDAMKAVFGGAKFKDIFVKYSQNSDNTYNLIDTKAANVLAMSTGDATLDSGNKTYTYDNTPKTVVVNSSTVLVAKTSVTGDGAYKAWTGVKNYPNVGAMTDAGTKIYAQNGIAQFIFLKAGSSTGLVTIGNVAEYRYLTFASGAPTNSEIVDGETIYTYTVFYNGAIKNDLKSKLNTLGTVGTVYMDPEFDSDGLLTKVGTEVTSQLNTPGTSVTLTDASSGFGVATVGWTDPNAFVGTYNKSSDFVCVLIYKNAAGGYGYNYVGVPSAGATTAALVSGVGSGDAHSAGDKVYGTFNDKGELNAIYVFFNTYAP